MSGARQYAPMLFERLPAAVHGEVAVIVVDAYGMIRERAGFEDGTVIESSDAGVRVHARADRAILQRALADGDEVVATFARGRAEVVRPFLEALLDLIGDKQAIEADMESMQPSSLALLEELSMFYDTLPSLSTGRSEVEVIHMGLEALVVAASIERALYLHYDAVAGRCMLVAQVRADQEGRATVERALEAALFTRDDQTLWRVIEGEGDAVFVQVGERRRRRYGIEGLAERELVAVPVCYGESEQRVILGVLVAIDKRRNAYSSSESLGSQETKFLISTASMLGSVLGARRVGELDKELHLANAIQQQILPRQPARLTGFDLAGRCNNSGAVGGDYFDYLPMRDGRTLVAIADVSGHNLASGMIMVSARATLRAIASLHDSPSAVFDQFARVMHPDLTTTERFITAAAVAISGDAHAVSIVNAGHNDTMIYRAASGEVERVRSEATVVGFVRGVEHTETGIELQPGDVMLLYTDGVVEAMDESGEMMGEDRLSATLAAAAGGSADSVLEAVFDSVVRFSSRCRQGDDVTAVVIKAVVREGGVE